MNQTPAKLNFPHYFDKNRGFTKQTDLIKTQICEAAAALTRRNSAEIIQIYQRCVVVSICVRAGEWKNMAGFP